MLWLSVALLVAESAWAVNIILLTLLDAVYPSYCRYEVDAKSFISKEIIVYIIFLDAEKNLWHFLYIFKLLMYNIHVHYLKLFHFTFEFTNDIISPIICKHLYMYLILRLTLRETPCYTMQNYLFLNKVLLVIHKSVILVPLVMSANSPILLMSLLFPTNTFI